MQKILMGRDNPEGITLEKLLQQLQVEIQQKSEFLTEDSDLARLIIASNDKIISLLKEAEETQKETMKEIERQRGPNKGPTLPRVL